MIECAGDAPVGFRVPPFRRHITREMARIHGAPMRNFHTVLEDARALGFDDLVIAGPMFTCFVSEMLTLCFGEAWVRGGELEIRFLKPVLARQTIAAAAIVTGHAPAAGGTRVELEIWCEREDDGARTSAGTAALTLPG